MNPNDVDSFEAPVLSRRQALLNAYINRPAKNSYYQSALNRLSIGEKLTFGWSWSWWAFFFGWIFLLYRKAYVPALLSFIGFILLLFVPVVGVFIYMFLSGGLSVYFVLNRFEKINEQAKELNQDEASDVMIRFGGTHEWVKWLMVLSNLLMLIGGILVAVASLLNDDQWGLKKWLGSLDTDGVKDVLGIAEDKLTQAHRYYHGEGVTQDYAQAFSLYLPLAEQGNAEAQKMLGLMYEKGHGVTQDDGQSAYWYYMSAQQGNADAQYEIGLNYEYGVGVDQDYEKAAYWHLRAAEQGIVNAQVKLGILYYKGQGLEQNFEQSAVWSRKAAEQGDSTGQYNLAFLLENGLGVEKDYAQAVEWYKKASDQGDENAEFNLAVIYSTKETGIKDHAHALATFTKLANTNDVEAQYQLGRLYSDGIGVDKNELEAINWYKKSAQQGFSNAQVILAGKYYDGVGVKKDPVLALFYLLVAKNDGNLVAIYSFDQYKKAVNKAQLSEAEKLFSQWVVGNELPVVSKTGIVEEKAVTKPTQINTPTKVMSHESKVWIGEIASKIKRAWIYPNHENVTCEVMLRQIRNGEVKEVRVKTCEGEATEAYKRSVELAVRRASPLPMASSDEVFKEEMLILFKP